MKIGLDKKKYKKRINYLIFGSFTCLIAFIMIVIMNVVENNKFDLKKIGVLIGLLLLLSFFSYLLRFYFRLRAIKDCVIELQNGELNDYSKPFNRASFLKLEDIKSISFWGITKGIHQFKIVTQNGNAKSKGLSNQLKGNHFYISDYVVDTNQLISMIELIDKNAYKEGNALLQDLTSKQNDIDRK